MDLKTYIEKEDKYKGDIANILDEDNCPEDCEHKEYYTDLMPWGDRDVPLTRWECRCTAIDGGCDINDCPLYNAHLDSLQDEWEREYEEQKCMK